MKLEEIKNMLPQKPERLETVGEPKRTELVKACYDLVGCLHEVYKELGSVFRSIFIKRPLPRCSKLKALPSTRR